MGNGRFTIAIWVIALTTEIALTIIIALSIEKAPLVTRDSDLVSMKKPKRDVDDVFDFFPDCDNDGLNLRWAHAVNSWPQLNDTLIGEVVNRVHMIEADVIIRQQSPSNGNDEKIAVMGHPPATDGNLTFSDWLTTINEFRINRSQQEQLRVGAKADYKSLEAAKVSLEFVRAYRSELSVPLWLNADIVHGPGGGGPATPVNAEQFLRSCMNYGAGLTLSLGWTTPPKVEELRCGKGYGWLDILAIYRKVLPFLLETAASSHPPRITFAVRAALLRPSIRRFLWLLNACTAASGAERHKDRFSITLWTSASADRLDQDDYFSINYLRTVAGKNRVFIDLPNSDIDCLMNATIVGAEHGSFNGFDISQWELTNNISDSSVVTGEHFGIVFLGQTVVQLKTTEHFQSDSFLRGRVIFVPASADSEDSLSISIVDEAIDGTIWTVKLSASRCVGDEEHNRRQDCIHLWKSEEPYSFSVRVSGHEVVISWKLMSDFLPKETQSRSQTCGGVHLNCTESSSSPSPASKLEEFTITLTRPPSSYAFILEKHGQGDLIMEELAVGCNASASVGSVF